MGYGHNGVCPSETKYPDVSQPALKTDSDESVKNIRKQPAW
jgi:hypothetical protein